MTERFTLLSELGRGGMGVVWKARDEETGTIVALKLLREAYADDPDYLKRFERELDLARRINSVHVVKVLGYGVRQRVPYLALEYVDGPSLHDALTSHGPYSWAEARGLLVQIAQGLADAHTAGVIHRDVKPSNVLMGPDGIAKLTDFGIARGLDATRMTATSTMLGTPAYLAPEGPKDARSDLYSLGIIGYQLLTGAVPFNGQSYQEILLAHLRDAPDLTRLPAETRPIIGWLLAKDPTERPRNAWEAIPVFEGRLFITLRNNAEPLNQATARPLPVTEGPAPPRGPGQLPPGIRTSEPPWPPVRVRVVSPASGNNSTAASLASVSVELVRAQPFARARHTASLLPGGSVLFAGGRDTHHALHSAVLYEPKAGGLSRLQPMAFDRSDHAAASLQNGRVLVCGGLSGRILASAELSDSRASSFMETGSMTTPRRRHSATLLPGGVVLVAGGWDGRRELDDAEVYDATNGQFQSVGTMFSPRESHTASLLRDGQVLLSGGLCVGYPQDSAEIYDAPTKFFRRVGSMTSARSGHTATLLRDGSVLVVGGRLNDPLNSAECFDPQSGTYRPVSPMRVAREGHTATLTGDGLVLIIGGANETGALAPIEAYDPSTGRFFDVGRIDKARVDHTATLLPDGRMLIAGGFDTAGRPLDSIELLTLEYQQ
jgi:serine/threonine protein kinase